MSDSCEQGSPLHAPWVGDDHRTARSSEKRDVVPDSQPRDISTSQGTRGGRT